MTFQPLWKDFISGAARLFRSASLLASALRRSSCSLLIA